MKLPFWLFSSFAAFIFCVRVAGAKDPKTKAKAKYGKVVESLESIGDKFLAPSPECKEVCSKVEVVDGAIQGFRTVAPAVVAGMAPEDMLSTIRPNLARLRESWQEMAAKIGSDCDKTPECKGLSIEAINDDLETLDALYKDPFGAGEDEELFKLDSKTLEIADSAVSLYRNTIIEPKLNKDSSKITGWLNKLTGVLNQTEKLYKKVTELVESNPKDKAFILHRYRLDEYLQRLFKSLAKASEKIKSILSEKESPLNPATQTLQGFDKRMNDIIGPFEELLNSPRPAPHGEDTIKMSDEILDAEEKPTVKPEKFRGEAAINTEKPTEDPVISVEELKENPVISLEKPEEKTTESFEDAAQVAALTDNVSTSTTFDEPPRVPHIPLPPVTSYDPSGKTGAYRPSGPPSRPKQDHGFAHMPAAAASATAATANESFWQEHKLLIHGALAFLAISTTAMAVYFHFFHQTAAVAADDSSNMA